MRTGIRERLKRLFDSIVYRYPLVNKILRNLNKLAAPLTSFKLRPFGVIRIKLENGTSFLMATNETNSVTKLLFWNGADNYEYSSIFIKIIPHCNFFIDVGSNTGYYSLLAAKINQDIKVFALEPALAPLQYLRKNVSLNSLTQSISIFDLALSESKDKMDFFEVGNDEEGKEILAGSGSLHPTDTPAGKFKIRIVNTETLDDFISSNCISKVDLIKLDTEGTEHLILKSAETTLRHSRPVIICETLFQVIEPELEKIMKGYDYCFYNFQGGKLCRTESIVREVDNGVRDCFFVPQEKEDWIKRFV